MGPAEAAAAAGGLDEFDQLLHAYFWLLVAERKERNAPADRHGECTIGVAAHIIPSADQTNFSRIDHFTKSIFIQF